MSDYANHLFSYLPPERLGTFSYGHVIPKTNLVAQSLTQGLMGNEFDFTYEARNSEKMVSIAFVPYFAMTIIDTEHRSPILDER